MQVIRALTKQASKEKWAIDTAMLDLYDYSRAHPKIHEFLSVLFEEDKRLAHDVAMLVYDLGYHINFDTDEGTLEELRSFIGNYFLDDSYFEVVAKKTGSPYCLAPDLSQGNGTQDPLAILDAARANKAYFDKVYARVKAVGPIAAHREMMEEERKQLEQKRSIA